MLPEPGTVVELSVADGPLSGVRVVTGAPDAPPGSVTLSLALAAVPPVGSTVELRWPAGPRGRWVVAVRVEAAEENRIRVAPAGSAAIEQHRNFVRGGGGEEVLLRRPRCPDVLGWVRDISEQGLRAHFADVVLAEGEEIRLRVQLDNQVVDVAAVTSTVASLRQSLPQRGPMSVEVVATLLPDEHQAQLIRRYVMRQQVLTRARTGD
jgi:hypothetical protein